MTSQKIFPRWFHDLPELPRTERGRHALLTRLSRYLRIVPATFSGIPCLVGVHYFRAIPPWRGSAQSCPSDLDWTGYTEAEWDLLNLRGYRIEWLERKVDEGDVLQLLEGLEW